MRINKYVAAALSIGRRQADKLIDDGKIMLNGVVPQPGQLVASEDTVTHKDTVLRINAKEITILLHKPVGYVCSRNGQGSKTIYDLLPANLHSLNPAGRLDKDTSGLLIMTNDGNLIEQLTHPRYEKEKIYHVETNRELTYEELQSLTTGVKLDDGLSAFKSVKVIGPKKYEVVLTEGRNRQIRRTFGMLKHWIKQLHRTKFGPYQLGNLAAGQYKSV